MAARPFTTGPYPSVEDIYTVGPVLGRGSFSLVLSGRRRVSPSDLVALKMVPIKTYKRSDRARRQIKTEVALLRRLNQIGHPNIVQFFHTFEDEIKVTLVLEHLGGGNILQRLSRLVEYTEQQASALVRILTEAVAVMHGAGIIHRDLSPDNLRFAHSGHDAPIKIVGFGHAADCVGTGGVVMDTHIVGTTGFIAPEILCEEGYAGPRPYSPASDMFAVGVILYVVLSGAEPFPGDRRASDARVRRRQWGFNHPSWQHVSEGAKDLVRWLLAQDPSQRLTAMQVLDHPWVRGERVPDCNLPLTIQGIQRLNMRHAFRSGALACLASGRIQRLGHMVHIGTRSRVVQHMDARLGHFTVERLVRLKKAFMGAAVHGCGVDFESFSRIMSSQSMGRLPLAAIFGLLDTDGAGVVDYRHFLLGLSRLRLEGEEYIRFCFEVYNQDGSGCISRDDLTRALCLARLHRSHHINSRTESKEGVVYKVDVDFLDQRLAGQHPEADEIAEEIAELFDRANCADENQVSMNGFLCGAKRHPALITSFFCRSGRSPLLSEAF